MDDENMSLNKLIEAAKRGNWDFVDGCITQVCDNDAYLVWARGKGFYDKDGNVRDLAVSIYEKTNRDDLFEGFVKIKLRSLMESDDNPYVRYRSAFALYGHGSRDDEVVGVLKEAMEDGDVGDIARSYLEKE